MIRLPCLASLSTAPRHWWGMTVDPRRRTVGWLPGRSPPGQTEECLIWMNALPVVFWFRIESREPLTVAPDLVGR